MSDVNVTWRGDEFAAKMAVAANEGVTKMATELGAKMKRNLSGIEGGGPITRHVSKRSGKVYWSGPGAPVGSLPFIRSAALRNRITVTPAKGLVAFAGSNMPRARALEFSTRRMGPRPWAMRSAREATPAMARVFRTHMQSKIAAALPGGAR